MKHWKFGILRKARICSRQAAAVECRSFCRLYQLHVAAREAKPDTLIVDGKVLRRHLNKIMHAGFGVVSEAEPISIRVPR